MSAVIRSLGFDSNDTGLIKKHLRAMVSTIARASGVRALRGAGLSLDWLHEHAQVPWQMFHILVKRDDGDWHEQRS